MKSSGTKKTKKASFAKDFNHFVKHHTDLSSEDIQYVKDLFQHDHIRKTLRVSLIIFLWSIVNSFIDVLLIGWGAVETAVVGLSISNFVPWFLFMGSTFTLKFLVITKMDTDNYYTRGQRALGAIPSIGVFFFISSVLAHEKIMLKTTREYLRYIQQRGITYIITILHKAASFK